MGHLFVAQGDLTKLACDAILIPCDKRLNVNDVWLPLLPEGLGRGDMPGWVRIDGSPNKHGVIDLPDSGKRVVRAFVSPLSGYDKPRQPIDRLWTALAGISGEVGTSRRRSRPLIGIPLVGTGDGGLKNRRGEVIAKLMKRHRKTPLHCDLALILNDRRDFAAVQNHRKHDTDWPELGVHSRVTADRLGGLAANKELSLFLGSGVSRPAGLPDWERLLELLAERAGFKCPPLDGRFEEAAKEIKSKLGDDYEPEMRALLDVDVHAVGHALLAGLQVNQMVTTNFDPCMELALEATNGDSFRVLVRQLADGGLAWLLKLHGDIRVPGSLILDSDDFARHAADNQAVQGVVQSLLLTSHLLFVGFSLRDKNFLQLADTVARVRRHAEDARSRPIGTALALTEADAEAMHYEDLDTVTMIESGADEAARLLEIFLDRLAWTAVKNHELSAEYLLDDRYYSGLSKADRKLRTSLLDLVAKATHREKASPGWARVASCLRDLGAKLN